MLGSRVLCKSRGRKYGASLDQTHAKEHSTTQCKMQKYIIINMRTKCSGAGFYVEDRKKVWGLPGSNARKGTLDDAMQRKSI